MNEANTKKLYADFPRLYREVIAGKRMHWGIECGDGWFDLAYKLSADVEAEANALNLNQKQWPTALQVKEKFGTLSYYLAVGKRNIDGRGMLPSFVPLIEKAGEESITTCETCGKPGILYQSSYWHVACATCEAGYEEQRKNVS